MVSERLDAPWRRRLFLPSYQIAEAAAYAQISPQTVAAWHKIETDLLAQREKRAALSYMQLIEVAVVAAFRRVGVPLKRIRAAREYAARTLKSEFPFAEYKFKLIFDSWGRVTARKLLILLVWGTDFSKV